MLNLVQLDRLARGRRVEDSKTAELIGGEGSWRKDFLYGDTSTPVCGDRGMVIGLQYAGR